MTEIKAQDLGTCPFCGKKIGFTVDTNNDPDGLVHEMPMCLTFEALDPLEYITQVRNAEQARRNIS